MRQLKLWRKNNGNASKCITNYYNAWFPWSVDIWMGRYVQAHEENEKRAKEIKEGIGKELAEALKENTRLEKLSDQVLADLEEKNKEIEQLRSAKTALKKENRELKEQLLAKSEDAKTIDIQVK